MATPSQALAPNKAAGVALQTFLNAHGKHEPLLLDGVCGKITAAAIYTTFRNKNATAVTDDDIERFAQMLGDKSTARVRAVAEVETSGSGWNTDGSPKILYERHYFWQMTNGRTGVQWFAAPSNGDYTLDANKNAINDSWEKMAAASYYDARAAFKSVSMSSFQIMGKWHKELGYNEPWEMLWDITNSEAKHYELMVKWIILNGKKKEFLAISGNAETCRAFALFWNGKTYADKGYHTKTAKAALRLSLPYGPL